MGQNRDSRNRPMHIWPIEFEQRFQSNLMEKGQCFQHTVPEDWISI